MKRGVGREIPGILRGDCITSIVAVANVGSVEDVASVCSVVEVGLVADQSGKEVVADASDVEVVLDASEVVVHEEWSGELDVDVRCDNKACNVWVIKSVSCFRWVASCCRCSSSCFI